MLVVTAFLYRVIRSRPAGASFSAQGRGKSLGADCVVLAVRHKEYLNLDPDFVVGLSGKPMAVIDCFGMLDDARIKRYFELGCEVKGLGRGHVKRIKDGVHKDRHG